MNTLIFLMFALTSAYPILTEIEVPDVKPIKTDLNELNCAGITIHKNDENVSIISTLQPGENPVYDISMPVSGLWFISFLKVLKTNEELHILNGNDVVKVVTPKEFRQWMTNEKYSDEYITVTFDRCTSVDQLAGYINDDLHKQGFKNVKKMYKSISYTKDAFFCADQVVCIKNYCKNSIYNPKTQLCYYTAHDNEFVDINDNIFLIN